MTKDEFLAQLKRLGLGVTSLARLLEIPQPTVNQWAIGRRPVRVEVVEWLDSLEAWHKRNPPPKWVQKGHKSRPNWRTENIKKSVDAPIQLEDNN